MPKGRRGLLTGLHAPGYKSFGLSAAVGMGGREAIYISDIIGLALEADEFFGRYHGHDISGKQPVGTNAMARWAGSGCSRE